MPAQLIRIGSGFDPVVIMVHDTGIDVPVRVPALLPTHGYFYLRRVGEYEHLFGKPFEEISHAFARFTLTIACESWGHEEEEEARRRLFSSLEAARDFLACRRPRLEPTMPICVPVH